MLLLAIAVTCLGLGIHQLTTSGDDPDAGLKAAGQSAEAAAESTKHEAATTSKAPESTTSTAATPVEGVPSICVLNAGNVTGLAGEVKDELTAKGFTVSTAENLSTASVSENTIFYTPDQEEGAKKVAEAVPGGAELNPRPDVFTRCLGELAVVVVSR